MDKKKLEYIINNVIFQVKNNKLNKKNFFTMLKNISDFITGIEIFAEDMGEHNIILNYRIDKLQKEQERLLKLLFLLNVDKTTVEEMDFKTIDFIYNNFESYKTIDISVIWKTYEKLHDINNYCYIEGITKKIETTKDIKDFKLSLN